MTTREFERLFEPSMRLLFNFDRARRERWPVELRVITERAALGGLLLPWRHTVRSPAKQLHVGEGGTNHTVASAASYLWALEEKRRLAVLEEAVAAMEAHPRATLLPCARISRGLLVFDGCHRAVATYLAGTTFEIALAAIRVPRNTDWSTVDA